MRFGISAVAGAFLLATTGTLATTGSASAQGWTISDLGTMPSREACMRLAEDVIYRYRRVFGGGFVSAASWTQYMYDVEPGTNHIVVMCPIVNGVLNAFLVTHGASGEENRQLVHDRLERYWESMR